MKLKWGTREAYKRYPMMTAKEYVQQRIEDYKLTGQTLSSGDIAQYIIAENSSVDWQDEAFRSNPNYFSADFSISGWG